MAEPGTLYNKLKKKCDCLVCQTTRYYVIFMLFMGVTCAYIMRTNMSVSIYAMVNHSLSDKFSNEPRCSGHNGSKGALSNGTFDWNSTVQFHAYSSFLYGYTLTQIPIAILILKHGAKNFLGWGMFLNSVLGFSVPLAGHKYGALGLSVLRFMQGLCEGALVPCTHTLLGKWVPPTERSRMCATVYAGAEFGAVIALPISGLLAEHGFAGGWPSTFFIYGILSLFWSIALLGSVYEDPIVHPKIKNEEKKFINQAIWDNGSPREKLQVPYGPILTCCPFYAIFFANLSQSLGYVLLKTEVPLFFYHMLNFSFRENLALGTIPFIAMWICSILLSLLADWIIVTKRLSVTSTRRIMNTVGQCGPAIALMAISFVGCSWIAALSLMTIGLCLNGAIYSGFQANHLDLSPRYAGLTAAITNSVSSLFCVAVPYIIDAIIDGKHTIVRWRTVLFLVAGFNITCAILYKFFSSANQQWWNRPITTTSRSQTTSRKSRLGRKSKARLSSVSMQPSV